jgi:hypothetical protein
MRIWCIKIGIVLALLTSALAKHKVFWLFFSSEFFRSKFEFCRTDICSNITKLHLYTSQTGLTCPPV